MDTETECKTCSKCNVLREISEFYKTDKGYRGECKYCKAEYGRNRYDPKAGREGHLRRKYNLTEEQYGHMYQSVHGRCQICGKHKKVLHIDHDHSTGIVRGLLCSPCNTAIGLFKENPVIILSAIHYLERN